MFEQLRGYKLNNLTLELSDFSRFDTETATTITRELNHVLERVVNSPEEPYKSEDALNDLKKDMIAAPQLYLDDSTLNRLNINDLLDPQ